MARGSISRGGGTVNHNQEVAKLADHYSMSPKKVKCPAYRRSSRLREIASIYESEAANAVNLSSNLQQETSQSNIPLSPKQSNSVRLLSKLRHSPQKGLNHSIETIDSGDDESYTSITLRDLQKRWKIKKRKASNVNGQVHDMQMHNIAHMEKAKEEDELDETIYNLKVKMVKSSPTGGKKRKPNQPSLHSSPVQEKTMHTCSSANVASLNGLNAATLMETHSDELPAGCNVDLEHKIENLHRKMETFAEQSPDSGRNSEPTLSIKKEIVETCFLNESAAENSRMNSTPNFVNECYFDIESSAEVFERVSEREADCILPTSSIGDTMDPFAIDLIKQNTQYFSSSSRHKLESCQILGHEAINVENEHLLNGSSECESMTPKVELIAELKHQINLKNGGVKDLLFEDSILDDKNVLHLIAAKKSVELFDSDSEKFTCSLENDGCLAGDREIRFSHKSFNKDIVSSVSEFMSYSCDDIDGSVVDSDASLSIENHNIFVGGMQNDNRVKNSCLDVILSHESLGTDSVRDYSTVNGNCGDLVNDFLEPTSTCSTNNLSQMVCNLSSDTLDSFDISNSVTEDESPHFNPICKDGLQASATDDDCPDQHSYGCITATNYVLDADEWAPRHDKLLPSSQAHQLNRCSEKQQQCCINIPDKPDTERLARQIMYDFPDPQPHESKLSNLDQKNDGMLKQGSSMDAITDSLTSSSLDISIQVEVERLKTNIQPTVIHPAETKFSGNQHMDVHSPKKLLSNRKEMSPNSQGKLLQAFKECGLDDVIELSNGINKLSFDKGATVRPLSSVVDYGETFLGTETKKPKTLNQPLQLTKGILKSPDIICCNTCCSKNSSLHTHVHGAILFSQRQMQDTESIATKLLEGLNTLKSIVQESLFSEEVSSPSKYNVEEMRLATKRASKLEVTTKKWLAMMEKDCNRFCKIMGLVERKMASPVSDVHKERKKITFADEAGGLLCQVKVYEQQPVAFIVPKN